MTFREYISDHLSKMIMQFLFMTLLSFILLITGTQPGIVALLLVILLPVWAIASGIDFFKRRARLQELHNIMNHLDQKYLFAECVPAPKTNYERKLLALMRRSYQSMTGAVSDAQAAGREYREYVESWVHEIKSPITAAKLIAHRLDTDSGRRLTKELAQIEAHVERALFYARAENPERDFIIQEVNLEEIVTETIAAYRTLLIQNNMRIETENLGFPVYTDRKWACFLLGQLLQNAARYRSDTPVITISAKPDKHFLVLTVSDNGIGIPAHELPRVFDRGFTGSNGRSRGGSTGMGLYLCRKISTLLGIDLQITSVEHQGTQVTLSFPTR